MNDRIQLILKTKNISASKFADEIGVQRSSISHILSGRNNASLEFIQKILKRFPDINSDWIISGKGSMYKDIDLFSGLEEPKTEKVESTEEILVPEEAIEKAKEIADEQPNTIEVKVRNKSQVKETVEKSKEISRKENASVPAKQENAHSQEIVMKAVGKKIERIIIFYSNKSCIEYIPE